MLSLVRTGMSDIQSAYHLGVLTKSPRSTQSCIPPNQVPAMADVQAGMSPLLSGMKHSAIPYGMLPPLAVRLAANCYTVTYLTLFHRHTRASYVYNGCLACSVNSRIHSSVKYRCKCAGLPLSTRATVG